MKESEIVRKYMAKHLITFRADDDINDAMAIILKHKISGAPVVDANKNLVGMLSESDCIETVLDGAYNNQPGGNGTVGDYMSRKVMTIEPDKTIIELATKFVNTPYRRFPVVARGKLVGQISISDVLRSIVKSRPKLQHTPSSWKIREPQDKGVRK
ncbi:MAG: CBS domain-containing protein [Saprospiraceae bacterium]|nr:CBS domain-containing protein [Saprospiraceae bacterium]